MVRRPVESEPVRIDAADLAALAPDHDPMPLGTFLFLPSLVGPRFVGCQAELANAGTARRVAHVRVRSEVTDENDFVDSTCHRAAAPSQGFERRGR